MVEIHPCKRAQEQRRNHLEDADHRHLQGGAGRLIHEPQQSHLGQVLAYLGNEAAYDRSAGFVYESEILIEASRRGLSIVSAPVAALYGGHLRRSHFRQVEDITLIVRMVGWKSISRGLCVNSESPSPQR
jgi:hypothetical protein